MVNNVGGIIGGQYIMFWTATGSNLDQNPQLGTVIGNITQYDNTVPPKIPYSAFKASNNNFGYLVQRGQVARYSKNYPFDMTSTPMLRPDDVPVSFDPLLSQPCMVVNEDIGKLNCRNNVTLVNRNNSGILFGLPTYDDWNKNDCIGIAAYLNGWSGLSNYTKLKTSIWVPEKKFTGDDYESDFDQDGNPWLIFPVPDSVLKDYTVYNQMPDNPGYFWLTYTVNETRLAPWYVARLDYESTPGLRGR